MKTTRFFVAVLLLGTLAAQRQDEKHPFGVLHGIVTGLDGQRVIGIGVTAMPQGGMAAVAPHTRTNNFGEYRFDPLPWWGKYTVYADDEEAGYSEFSTGFGGNGQPASVEVTPAHPQAELNILLPPPAGFLRIHLTNRRTGEHIVVMRITLFAKGNLTAPLLSAGCYSTKTTLVPPQKDLLLHVTSNGFREWSESVEKGKPLRLPSGGRLMLDVQLEPE